MKIKHVLPIITCLAVFGCASIPNSYAPPPFAREFSGRYQKSLLSAENMQFSAGFAKKKITPQNTQWLAGKEPRLGTKTFGDLWARCLVLGDQEGNSVAIASLDLLGLMPSDVRDIQNRVKNFFGGRVLIHTTHTHSAPDTMGFWGPRLIFVPVLSGRDEEYIKTVKENVVSCIADAGKYLMPAVVAFAKTTLESAVSGPRDMTNDESLLVMQVETEKERVLLLNFAVHPETIKQDYVTADFLHYVYEYLGKFTGSEVIFINGAIGGVQPKGLPGKANEWHNAQNLASAMIQKTLSVLPNVKVSKSNKITSVLGIAGVRLENKLWKFAVSIGLIPDERDELTGNVQVELNYLRIGDAGIITFPGEAFPNIAIKLKSQMPDEYKFTFGLTNGELGYFLFDDDVKSGKYKYHSSVSLGPRTGSIIFDVLSVLIRSHKN